MTHGCVFACLQLQVEDVLRVAHSPPHTRSSSLMLLSGVQLISLPERMHTAGHPTPSMVTRGVGKHVARHLAKHVAIVGREALGEEAKFLVSAVCGMELLSLQAVRR